MQSWHVYWTLQSRGRGKRWPTGVIGVACLLAVPATQAQQVTLIQVKGTIGPATADYISRAIDESAEQGAACLIIELDTPGGLLDSTRTIVRALLSPRVPTVIYVAPAGAGAISAGCFITLAADVAVMAPATNIGAATPVGVGGEPSETMQQKLESFAVSYIETIAAQRERNVEWASAAVRESASITAEKALELGVIDFIAQDRADLLAQLDGREVGERTLRTAGAQVVEIEMTLRERIFQSIWRPEVMFILMLIAVYGIIGELSNPGAVFPGTLGVIALILLLYMAAALPINIAGLAIIGVALLLFIAEVFTPTYGILTTGGIIVFIIGSLMLFDHPEPVFRLSLAVIVPAAVITAIFFLFVVGAGLRAQWLPVRAGAETLWGQTAEAITPIDRDGGKVFIEGEVWNAVSETPVSRGERVEVLSATGLTLKVAPMRP